MKKEEIFEYVKKQYGTMPEYLWAQSPDNAVLRHKNGKWYQDKVLSHLDAGTHTVHPHSYFHG